MEEERPRSGHGTLLCPTHLLGASEPMATNDVIGINSNSMPHGSMPLAQHGASTAVMPAARHPQPLAYRATAQEINDGQQNNRPEQRDQKRWQAKVVLVDSANAEQGR